MKQMNNPLITIIYNNIRFYNDHGKFAFFFWLKRIKAIKDHKEINSKEVHLYIDTTKINYMQLLSLYSLFLVYRARGKEQLEQLLFYLPQDDIEYFDQYEQNPWKEKISKEDIKIKKLKNKIDA